ncbi:MAG: hypothetical protein WCL14_03490 [Bacteroidota bacterium]
MYVFLSYLGSFLWQKSFRSYLPSEIAPIVAAARCFVSVMGRQRLQRIAGRRWDEKRA